MKISYIIIAFVLLFSVSCASNPSKEHGHDDGTGEYGHSHEEGTEGHGHDHDEDEHHEQEEFSVDGDSTHVKNDSSHHSHENGDDHHH